MSDHEWCDGSGRLNLTLSEAEVSKGYHTGRCDDDIAELAAMPHIREQLDALGPQYIREALREWGYEDEELDDPAVNRERLLWLACGDLFDRVSEE